jgi:four helix bundle protein
MSQEYGLEKLNVWRKAMDLAVWISKEILPLLPKEERYALSDQLRRSVQSIPANIAEGYGRFYYQDNIRFCYIARGSLEETRSHLIYAHEMEYLTTELFQNAESDIAGLRHLLSGYIAYLKSSKPGSSEPGNIIREESPDYKIMDTEESMLE